MRLRNHQCLRIFFLLLFLTHKVSQCYMLVINFLVFWSICLSSFLVHFKNNSYYLTTRAAQMFISLMRYLLQSLVSTCSLVLLRYSFLIFFLHLHWWCLFPIFPSTFSFLSLQASKCTLDLVVIFIPLILFSHFLIISTAYFSMSIPFLYPVAQSAGAVEYTDCTSAED